MRLCKAIKVLIFIANADQAEIRRETDIISDFREFLMVFEDFEKKKLF